MAKVIKKKKQNKRAISPFRIEWTKENYIIASIGLFLLIIGFFLMSQGPWDNPLSLSVSPVVLLIAYLIIFPLAILYKKKKAVENDSSEG
ncbi:MAG: DUF3098 domain-containing protein [Bacteroidetes bacterium]|nr:DUF3098 domain-containing protein [Bacteroidota bacterium]